MTKISPEAQRHLTAAAAARDGERDTRAALQAEIKDKMVGVRAVTNAAIYEAWKAGASKAAILRHLRTTNQIEVDERLTEHARTIGLTLTTTASGTVITPAAGTPKHAPSVLAVTKTDDTLTVTMNGFTHPDVGDQVHGTVTYDTDGEVVTVEPDDLFAQDPLMPLRIWGLPEVQNA